LEVFLIFCIKCKSLTRKFHSKSSNVLTMFSSRMISTFIILTFSHISVMHCYSLSQFYPFGPAAGDSNLPANDDGSTSQIPLAVPFPFFGSSYNSIYVRTFCSFPPKIL
jgi:hypothetical protein